MAHNLPGGFWASCPVAARKEAAVPPGRAGGHILDPASHPSSERAAKCAPRLIGPRWQCSQPWAGLLPAASTARSKVCVWWGK